MKKTSLLLLLLSTLLSAMAQVFIEQAPVGAAAVGEYNFYGTGTLNKSIPYNRIKGSPFWSDRWQLATLYSGNRRFSTLPARLNLATHEIHFLQQEKELVATPENGITAIVFHQNNDTALALAAFRKEMQEPYLPGQPFSGFMQLLNYGHYQLLKFTDRAVGSADTLFGTQKRYFFRDNVSYFIRAKELVKPIKKLNEENVLTLLPSSSALNRWMQEQKLNLKREEDVLKLLAHYNVSMANSPR